METVNLIQGTPEWHAHRAQHFNASDAPAMMGCSPHTTRTELLHRLHTGTAPEVDQATQRRFDDGHRFEALARPLAEAIIGEDLYPVTGVEGKYSASFDGLTMDESKCFEHKTLNAALLACFDSPDFRDGISLPLQYRVQMEHQLMVSGADTCLFMASKWDGDVMVSRHCWYSSDATLRAQIVSGWAQLEKDLAEYVPAEKAATVTATPTLGLPAVSIQIGGSLALTDNLGAFGAALQNYIDGMTKKPETDQDFADLEASVKTLKKAEEALDAAQSGALAQTTSIDTMRKTVALYRDLARTNRLMAEKLVKTEKDARKVAIITAGRAALSKHEASLQDRTRNNLPPTSHNFEFVCKGLKTITSIQNAVSTELARCKIEANAVADEIEANLKTLDAAGHEYLFADVSKLVLKSPEDLANTIAMRVTAHQAKEAARIEADRERIRSEDLLKLEREQAVKDAKERRDAGAAALAERAAQAAKERDRIESERLAHAAATADQIKVEINAPSTQYSIQNIEPAPDLAGGGQTYGFFVVTETEKPNMELAAFCYHTPGVSSPLACESYPTQDVAAQFAAVFVGCLRLWERSDTAPVDMAAVVRSDKAVAT